jgi:hypothetical protein
MWARPRWCVPAVHLAVALGAIAPARAHEVNATGVVVLVDPVFDHPARPRNEVGVGTRLVALDGDGGLGTAWAVVVNGEVGSEEIATAGVRAAFLEVSDLHAGAPATRGVASAEAWVGLAAYRIGFPWRVFLTPSLVAAAARSAAATADAWTFTGRAELRAGVGVEGLPGFTFFAKQGLEARLPGRVAFSWASTYGLGYGVARGFSLLVEAGTRFDGRREHVALGPAVHFAPARGFRVDLGARVLVTRPDGPEPRFEALLVVRRELLAPW